MVGTAGEELIKRQYDVVSRKGKLSSKKKGAPYLVIWWDAIASFFFIDTYLVGQALCTFCNRYKNEPTILGLGAKKTKIFLSTEGNLMETELQFVQFRIFTSESL